MDLSIQGGIKVQIKWSNFYGLILKVTAQDMEMLSQKQPQRPETTTKGADLMKQVNLSVLYGLIYYYSFLRIRMSQVTQFNWCNFAAQDP